jgi:hypothetical protein
MTLLLYMQGAGVIFGLLAAVAWFKSAAEQAWPDKKPNGWFDRLLDRISSSPIKWNAIAALLTAIAAIFQALAFLITMPKNPPLF